MKRLLPYAIILLAGALSASTAEARTDRMLTYRQGQIWTSLVRFLRVDMGYRILERDREVGYLLFEYTEGGSDRSGSFEMIPTVESGRQYVKVRLQIPSMPTYIEVVLFGKFERKLLNEFGDPPTAAPVPAGKPVGAAAAQGGTAEGSGTAKKTPPQSEEEVGIDDDDLDDAVEEEE